MTSGETWWLQQRGNRQEPVVILAVCVQGWVLIRKKYTGKKYWVKAKNLEATN